MSEKERAILFIDARNLLGGSQNKNSSKKKAEFGYKETIDYFSKKFNLIRGYYYDGAPHKSQRSQRRERLYQQMITFISFQSSNAEKYD